MDPSGTPGGAPAAPVSTNLIGGAPPATAPAATPAPVTSAPSTDWRDDLGDDLKAHPSIATLPDKKTLAKAYVDLKSAYGEKIPTKPGPGASEAEVTKYKAFIQKLTGAPADPQEYGSLMPEGFDKDSWDPEMEKSFTALAHEHHLPPETAKAIAKMHAEGMKAIYDREVAAAQQQIDAGKADLQAAWGQDYLRHEAAVKSLAAFFGFPVEHDMFRDPTVMKAFAEKAPAILGGDKLVAGQAVGIAGGIAEKIDAIHRSDDYMGTNGPERQAAAQKTLHQLYAAQRQK